VTALHNSMPTPHRNTPSPAPLHEWGETALRRAAGAWSGVRRAVHGIRRAILGGESAAEADARGQREAHENEARRQRHRERMKRKRQRRQERRAQARRAAGGE